MTHEQGPQLGILLPTRGLFLKGDGPPDLAALFDLAQEAEAAGLDSVWVGDSLISKPRLEPLSTLAAVAMRTQRIKLGTAVLLAPLRNPVQLAQMAATVDVLSGGRLTLGMGVGGAFTESQKEEWHTVGVQVSERGSRMAELVQICRLLWTGEEVTFKGRFYQLNGVTMAPKPSRPEGIPLLLACHLTTGTEAQHRRAALYGDGIISISDSPSEFAETLKRVQRYASEGGRKPDDLRAAYYMTVNVNHSPEAAWSEADDFIRRYYGLNFWNDKWGPFGTPEEVARRIVEYYHAGAGEIIVRFASLDPFSQFRIFEKEVVPAVYEGALR